MDRQTVLPFLTVACAWLVLSLAMCARFPGVSTGYAFGSLALIWALCLLDLYSLSRAVGALLELSTTSGENRGVLTIQAFYWGMIKLLCLGILGIVLFYGRSIPATSMLAGTGTLVVVPLVGGYRWSQKVPQNAS
jgi:hypothetical protein